MARFGAFLLRAAAAAAWGEFFVKLRTSSGFRVIFYASLYTTIVHIIILELH